MKNTIVFALSSSVGLAKDICKELGLELGKCEVKHFADGEILVELGESVRGKQPASLTRAEKLSYIKAHLTQNCSA